MGTIIRYLDATKTLSQLRQVYTAKKKWIKVLSHGGPESAEDMQRRVQNVGAETLRLGRVRLDAVAMLLFRLFFATLTLVNIYLYADASPQWRGVELMATSFDMTCSTSDHISHRLLPLVCVGRSMLTAMGKCITILWQIFLMVGPRFQAMRDFLFAIRSITTDLGTERLLANQPDILIPFFKWIGGFIPKGSRPQEFLFPRAIVAVGWNHVVDGLLKRGLSSLRWFPKFLDQVKSINRFLRDNREEIVAECKAMGLEDEAKLFDKVRTPTFAAWRWGTLYNVCKELDKVLPVLIEVYPRWTFT